MVVIILVALVGQYAWLYWLSYKRIRAGHNGATMAIGQVSLAKGLLALVLVFHVLFHSSGGILVILGGTLFLIMRTNWQLMIALRLEAARPLNKETATRTNIFDKLDRKD